MLRDRRADQQKGRTMVIKRFLLGALSANCYVVSNEDTKECFLIDPASGSREVQQYVSENELKVQAILLTHGHFDHIMGVDKFLKVYPVPVYAHEEERLLLENASYNLSDLYAIPYTFTKAKYVQDGEFLNLAGEEVKVIHTPGHTSGGCCYYIEKEHILFSGDTLFRESSGRTDFPTGSQSQLVRSVREKLFLLPEETIVYPGHMSETTIEYEKKYNPYI